MKITVGQLKKLLAEQLKPKQSFVEKEIQELNEQIKFLTKIKESFAIQSPEDLHGDSSLFGRNMGDARDEKTMDFIKKDFDPKGTFGKSLAILIAKVSMLRNQVDSIPQFNFKEFVEWYVKAYGSDIYKSSDINDLAPAEMKDRIVAISAGLKKYKELKNKQAARTQA